MRQTRGQVCAAMKTATLVTRVKGSKQSKTVVTQRVTVMGLGGNGYMTYYIGAYCPFSLFRAIPLT